MAYKIGDMVKVVKQVGDTPFGEIAIGIVAPIVNVWDSEEYPYELEGFTECVCAEELELVAGGGVE